MSNDIKKRTMLIYGGISAVLLIVVIILFAQFVKQRNEISSEKEQTVATENGKKGKLFDNAEAPKEVLTFDTKIIEDGLREMGVLITEEYYFTQVEEMSKSKKVLFATSEATTTYSYDGVVSAGINCNNVQIDKDDEKKEITIRLPESEIKTVSIDKESFKVYEQKNGIFTKFNIEDYNSSLIEFEEAAKEKAREKGILDKADEGARKMIEAFARSLVDTNEYKISVVTE